MGAVCAHVNASLLEERRVSVVDIDCIPLYMNEM